MKDYPLEIIKGETGYMSKGHHDKQKFAAAVEALEEVDIHIDPEKVEHAHYRYIPCGWQEPGKGDYWPTRPGRGAFPVTVWED